MKNKIQIPKVKICCIQSIEEAWMAIEYGASSIGLVSHMPSGAGVISEELIGEIASIIPPSVTSILLTSLQNPLSIIEQHKKCKTNAIQIVDFLNLVELKELENALPGIGIIPVIHVAGKDSINEAISMIPFVNSILLDSGNKSAKIKELGGTGRTHDWRISREIRDRVEVPVFLAGGLNPTNIRDAIKQVAPFGVDVCSGLRTNGKLDEEKLRDFMNEVQSF